MFHQQLNWFVVLAFVCSISPSRSNGTPDLSTVKQFLNVESSTEPASSEPSHQLSGVDTFSLTFLNRNGRNLKEESTDSKEESNSKEESTSKEDATFEIQGDIYSWTLLIQNATLLKDTKNTDQDYQREYISAMLLLKIK